MCTVATKHAICEGLKNCGENFKPTFMSLVGLQTFRIRLF